MEARTIAPLKRSKLNACAAGLTGDSAGTPVLLRNPAFLRPFSNAPHLAHPSLGMTQGREGVETASQN